MTTMLMPLSVLLRTMIDDDEYLIAAQMVTVPSTILASSYLTTTVPFLSVKE